MKKILAALLAFCAIISLPGLAVSAAELKTNKQDEQIGNVAEAYLTLAAENTWQYTSHDLSSGTVLECLPDAKVETGLMSKAVIAEAMEGDGLTETAERLAIPTTEFSEYVEGISFVQNKSEYFKDMRQSQNIQRNDFTLKYDTLDVAVDGNTATVRTLESISFQYPDFPDVVSEVINEYSVQLILVDGEWIIADVVAENDWFDESFRELDFDAKNPQKSFDIVESNAMQAELEAEALLNVNIMPEETFKLAAASTTYTYNKANAAAYAYTYTTSKYNSVSNPSSTQMTDSRTYWNQNFRHYGPTTDCMNFASQCVWAGFGGSNEQSKISSRLAPMDTTGSYLWYGAVPGKESTAAWTSCSNFRNYVKGEAGTQLPDMYANTYEVNGSASFGSAYYSQMLGAVLHVNSLGHAVVVTDVNGSGRSNVLITAHTNDRKGIKVSEYWGNGNIFVIIPKQIRVYNPPAVRITSTLQRPVPLNSTVGLFSGTNVICSSIQVTVKPPSGSSTSQTKTNTSSNTLNYKFTKTGLYTVTTTAKKTASSAAETYVYTVRVY